ncbi:hypothetical protein ACEQ8H_005203 [Pleosporales sp. CAS-2024a]
MSNATPPSHRQTSDPPSPASNGPVKPTLLAFHGSGSNSMIHTVQLARLMRLLNPYFEVESIEAPFPSPAGPGILPFFDGCGPFKRWLPTATHVTPDSMRRGDSTSLLAPPVEALIKATIERVRAQPQGRVVGLIGFSQGTKIVAGLLRAAELRARFAMQDQEDEWCDFRFALSVCGSYPPGLFPQSIARKLPRGTTWLDDGKIQTPTFHVQGKQDEWMWAGQALIDKHYEVGDGHSQVVEWDMGHHYPVLPEQSEIIATWMIGMLKRSEGEGEQQPR